MNKKLTDNQIKELIRGAGKRFKLSASDKGILKANIIDVIGSEGVQANRRSITTHIINLRRLNMPLIPIIIAALIALGGGTAALADSAKPGDALYPVDQWVERMQERFTWTDEAKAGLFARFSEERLQELQALLAMDPEQLQATARERWELHREEATNRVAASIERVNAVRERFEEKLQGATDEDVQLEIQQVIDTMDEIVARRELRMGDITGSEFPGVGHLPIRQQVQEWTREHSQEMNQIREQIMEEFGDEMPNMGASNGKGTQSGGQGQSSIDPAIAYWPQPPIEIEIPEGIIEAQREWQERMAELRDQLAANLIEAFEQIDPFEDPNKPPMPEPMLVA